LEGIFDSVWFLSLRGILYFYLKGFPISRSAILGSANAAATVQHQGGVLGQQSRLGLAAMLEQYRVRFSEDRGIEITLQDR